MRAIFIFLLAANFIFWGYHYWDLGGTEGGIKKVSEPKQSTSIGAEKLLLLAERVNEEKSHGARPLKKQTTGAEEKADADLCTMIGPYNQLLQAEYALEHLVSLGIAAHITPVEIKEGELYWVYLPPEMSEREALRRLYELQSKGIESHIIAKGELTNGISFGRFADYVQAEARAAEIKNLGYGVDIKMLPKMIQEIWLVIEPGFDEKVGESVWATLLSKEYSLEKRQNFCLGVDSGQMFH
ncbi:SPOR domain-containing protein [Cellvibrio sp. pealriver]|uniref:SPOR domain-containing protein n=1 Tax=Cellvibrio sp. pealriver TaxID=1622269 RepID=UPI00066FD498|nr:SPOR domain-containing protein [Cellvibrio sp. pealriver]